MRWLSLWLLPACGAGGGTSNEVVDGDAVPADCDGGGYPEGAVEPMALGEVLFPYSWPVAIHRGTRQEVPLDLGDAPCNQDPDIDWSPFEALLFVSIPAW